MRCLLISLCVALVACSDPTPPILVAGDSVQGSLTQHDTLAVEVGTFVDFFGIDVGAQERVAVVVSSDDFIPAVYLHRVTPSGLAMLPNHAGQLENESCIQVRPYVATRYRAIAASDDPEGLAVGRYTLRVQALADTAAAPHACRALDPSEMP